MEWIGRITGKGIRELTFRTEPGIEVNVGEILVVEGGNRKLFIRVTDLRYGTEAADDSWSNRTAGNMILQDRQGREFPMHDREKRLYISGIAMPLGFDADGEFLKAKTIPPHFSRVRRISEEEFDFLRKFTGDLHTGNLRSGERIIEGLDVGIDGRDIPSHVGVFATTGMGKSNLMKVLAASVMRKGEYGMLILDPHGEYYDGGGEEGRKGLIDLKISDERLEVYSSRELDGRYNRIKLSADEIKDTDIKNVYDFSEAQRDALSYARMRYDKNWILQLKNKSVEEIAQDFNQKVYVQTISVIKRRLELLFHSGLVTGDSSQSITRRIRKDLMDRKVVLVDTSNMFEKEELLVSTVIMRSIFEKNKMAYGDPNEFSKIPAMLLALEEAQRVLGMSKGNIFAQIAREGRKFRTGLCAVSQQPKLINNEVISQFNTLFIMGLADRRDREILKDSARQDIGQLDNEIQMLMPGEGLITSPKSPFALPVKIYLFEEKIKEWNDDYRPPDSVKMADRDEGFY